MLLQRCELEALKAHFSMLKLMASLSSTQLYAAHGYISEKPREFDIGSGLTITLVPMRKHLTTKPLPGEA